MRDNKVIRIADAVAALRRCPAGEMQLTHFLGGILRSTWWMVYDAERDLIGVSTNWFDYDWYTSDELLTDWADNWFAIDSIQ